MLLTIVQDLMKPKQYRGCQNLFVVVTTTLTNQMMAHDATTLHRMGD
jgi:hypothetical protein